MMKYIPLGFIVVVSHWLATTTQTAVVRYSAIGELETAERLLLPAWLFTAVAVILLALIAILAIFDLRKMSYGIEVCSSECDKKCRENDHYEWNN